MSLSEEKQFKKRLDYHNFDLDIQDHHNQLKKVTEKYDVIAISS